MKKSLPFLFFLSTCYMATSQTLYKAWDYRYGGYGDDYLECIMQTSDGGYMLGGYTNSGISGDVPGPVRGEQDYWIVKLDAAGQKQWTKRYGGDKNDYLRRVLQTVGGGYLMIGSSSSSVGGDKSEPNRSPIGGDDYWVVKTNAQGDLEWEKTFGGKDRDLGNNASTTIEGGYLLCGASDSRIEGDKTEDNWDTTGATGDYWIVKVDNQGNKQWDRRYGGRADDYLFDVCNTSDGGYLLSGSSYSSNTGNKGVGNYGFGDYWLVKIDTAGNKQWEQGMGGIAMDVFCYAIQLRDGGYIAAGSSLSQPAGNKTAPYYGGLDYWIVKLDSGGNILWDKSYGGGVEEQVSSITQTSDNGLLICGFSTTPFPNGTKTEANLGGLQTWLVKTDSVGNKQWDKTILTTGYSYGVALQSSDGCYVIGAATGSGQGGDKSQPNIVATDSTYDYWVIKFCEQPVGIQEITAQASVQIYPNPFVNEVSISIQKQHLREARFTLTNNLGQLLYDRRETNLADSYTKMLDLGNLPDGTYYITVETNGERITRQVVKE